MKRTDRLTEIKNIYKKFNRAEKEILRSNLSALQNAQVKGYEKAADLIELIALQPSLSKVDALKAIAKNKDTAIEQMSFFRTVKDALLENLTLNINLERPNNLSNRTRTSCTNAKKLAQAKLLLSRNAHGMALKLAEDVANRGMKYELFQDAVEAYKIIQFIESLGKGLKPYNRIAEYIAKAKKLSDAYDATQNIYIKFVVTASDSNNATTITGLEDAIKKLEAITSRLDVKHTLYTLSLLRMRLHTLKTEFTKAKTVGENLLEIIRKETSVQTEQREGQVLMEYAAVLYELKQYDEAREALRTASNIFKKSSYEGYLINKQMCVLEFTSGNRAELEALLKKHLLSKYTIRWPFAVAQYTYYSAVLNHLKGNNREAAFQLRSIIESKQGLNRDLMFNTYLMLFIVSVALNETEALQASADRQIALSGLNAMYESDTSLRKREKTIVRIVKRLDSNDLNFVKTLLFVKGSAERLTWPDNEYRRLAFSDEIIPFDDFMKKVRSAIPETRGRKKKVVPSKNG